MLSRLPWTPKPETKRKRWEAARKAKRRKLPKDRRDYLAGLVAAIIRKGLEKGEASKFWFEAKARHGIRARLCLQGWPWGEADEAAEDVVDLALRLVGAKRPSWQEGQPEYTQYGVSFIERTRCVRCGGKLPQGHRKFCSQRCFTAHHNHLARRRAEELIAILGEAGDEA